MKQGLGSVEIYNELLNLHAFVKVWALNLDNHTMGRKAIAKEMNKVLKELDERMKKSDKE